MVHCVIQIFKFLQYLKPYLPGGGGGGPGPGGSECASGGETTEMEVLLE